MTTYRAVHSGTHRGTATGRAAAALALLGLLLAFFFGVGAHESVAGAAPMPAHAAITPTPTPEIVPQYGSCELVITPSAESISVGETVSLQYEDLCTCPNEQACSFSFYELQSITSTGFEVPNTPTRSLSGSITMTATEPGYHDIELTFYGETFFGFYSWSYLSGSTSVLVHETPQPHIAYEESFEDGLGDWITDATAITGAFSVGTPEETRSRFDDFIVIQPDGASDGVNALVTDGRAGPWPGRWDIDRGRVTATSPAITIPGGTAELSLDWFWGHGFGRDGRDEFRIEVSTVDGSVSPMTIVELTDKTSRAGTWKTTTVDISDFAGTTIVIDVLATDVGRGSLSEAGLDNVEIVVFASPLPGQL